MCRRMPCRLLSALGVLALLMGCDQVTVTTGDISSSELEDFFRKHTVDGKHAVAMKKRSLGSVSYFATIHGYPNNLSVCEEVVERRKYLVPEAALSKH